MGKMKRNGGWILEDSGVAVQSSKLRVGVNRDYRIVECVGFNRERPQGQVRLDETELLAAMKAVLPYLDPVHFGGFAGEVQRERERRDAK